jgi:hypothetical protein
MKKEDNEPVSIWDMMDENYKESKSIIIKRFFRRFPRFFENLWGDIRIFFERLTHHGIARYDLMDLDHQICKWLLPRFQAFIKMKRYGYSSYFSEYDSNAYGTDGTYEKMVADGKIDFEVGTGLKSGPKKWEQVLKEIEFALDWKVNCDFGTDKQKEKFYLKWAYKNPHTKIDSNKNVSYIYHMTDKYKQEQEGLEPIVKKFGGLAKEVSSNEPDLHIKEPDNYIFIKERTFYYDCPYDMKISERAQAGFLLFGKHMGSFWD